MSGRPRSASSRSCVTTAVHAESSCCAGAGLRRPATREGCSTSATLTCTNRAASVAASRSGASTPPPAPCPSISAAAGRSAWCRWTRAGPWGVSSSSTLVIVAGSVRLLGEHMFVSGQAAILHADADSFYASVEQRDHPRLRGRPVIVGGGVVLAASYEAKAFGVRTAMGGGRARELCPRAVVVPPRMSAYSEASKRMFEVFEDTAPVVEGLSIDEAFLDVRGLEHISGTPEQIAVKLKRDVREQVGLPVTVGVARTKFLAKVASAVAKPDGLLVVPPERELEFLHPLPIERLWGVGAVTAEKLHRVGIETVGEVAELAEPALVSILGRASGRHIHALAHNRDPRRVQVGRRRRSIGAQHAMGRRTSWQQIEASLAALV